MFQKIENAYILVMESVSTEVLVSVPCLWVHMRAKILGVWQLPSLFLSILKLKVKYC